MAEKPDKAVDAPKKPIVSADEQKDLTHMFRIINSMIEHGKPGPGGPGRGHGPGPGGPGPHPGPGGPGPDPRCGHGPGPKPGPGGPDAPGPRPPHGGMHPGKHRVLKLLVDQDSMSQKDMMGQLGISASSLSEILHKLEDFGLITRERDAADKRNIIVKITEKGAVAFNEKELIRAERNEKLFSALTPQERETLGALLAKLVEAWHDDPQVLACMAPPRPAIRPVGHKGPMGPGGPGRGCPDGFEPDGGRCHDHDKGKGHGHGDDHCGDDRRHGHGKGHGHRH